MPVRMELRRIIISETREEQIIVLHEVGGNRSFPIIIGLWEAMAIDRNIRNKKTPRPLTHDLIENVIRGLDATLEKVVVNAIQNQTFFAQLVLKKNGAQVTIDARPSDAVAIAVQMGAPIDVDESVLDAVAPPPGAGPGS
ncbi:MAG: hypothetical protein A2Z34_05340 [Planctomycetes bacterium RBG_16_59_8]|nr:MAG: hypothetical protein A2Z34_05340 [Planctomycetes bacterium RBG_16_59_8]